jgi:CHAT domain-containing protein/tetratricopeptide (TPR) repeat protein
MDEQQTKAYWDLIIQLLKCPSNCGREEILRANSSIANPTLVQQMFLTAEVLKRSGQGSAAKDLQNYATQLAEEMGMLPDSKTPEGRKLMENQRFIFQCIQYSSTGGHTKEQIHQFFAKHITEFTEDKIEALSAFGSIIYAGVDIRSQISSASAFSAFGMAIQLFPKGNRAINLELAIIAYELALKVMTYEAMADQWLTTMNMRGLAYADRTRDDRTENIERAIAIYDEALQKISARAHQEDWAMISMNMACAYCLRIEGDRAQNIEYAIDIHKRALQFKQKGSLEYAQSMMNLGIAYVARLRENRAENIELALDAYHQALKIISRKDNPYDWALIMVNVGIAYDERPRGERSQNIEDAIDAYTQALYVLNYDDFPHDWSRATMNLAAAYCLRIKGDRAENLEESISLNQTAAQSITYDEMPIDWSQMMSNLGLAYSERIREEKLENIKKAIHCYEQSLLVRTLDKMPNEWAQSKINLGIAYSRLAHQTNWDANTQAAIDIWKQVLKVLSCENASVAWSAAMLNLAGAYINRVMNGDSKSAELAIDACQKALSVRTQKDAPTEWALLMMNLGLAYSHRAVGDPLKNIQQAISSYRSALTIFTPEQLPIDCRKTAYLLGSLYVENQQWSEACGVYQTALAATEVLYQASLFRGNQELVLFETNDLFRLAAYAYAKNSEYKQAAVVIERGRARGLSDALERDSARIAELKAAFPNVHERYKEASEALYQLEIEERSFSNAIASEQQALLSKQLRDQAGTIRQQFKDAITLVRAQPGFNDLFAQTSWKDIATAVLPQQPLVYLLYTHRSGLAIVIERSVEESAAQANPVWLPDLTKSFIYERFFSWLEVYKNRKEDFDKWLETMNSLTKDLWKFLMGPVVEFIENKKVASAILIPTGYLSFLPLHAAWSSSSPSETDALSERRYALDNIDLFYAPNARSVAVARAVAQNICLEKLLVVNEPRPTQESPLIHSEREVESAIAYFDSSCVLSHEQASRDRVLAVLAQQTVLHFSCHGKVDFDNPLKSGLIMSEDEMLTLKDFFDNKFQAIRLAILSACETGLPSLQIPDEAISLPTGLMQSGAAGVIASLWSVPELSTMLILSRFYHLWRGQGINPPEALIAAQRWLRDAQYSEILSHCEMFIPELSAKEGKSFKRGQSLKRALKLDYSHPYHWAAFTYTGV